MTILAVAAGGTVALVRHEAQTPKAAPVTGDAPLVDVPAALALARSTGKPVEASTENTETNTTYANPDGTLTRRMAVAPVRARKNGRWLPIDTTFEHTNGTWTTRASVSTITVNTAGTPTAGTSASPSSTATTGSGGQGGGTVLAAEPEPAAVQELVRMTTDQHTLALSWPAELPAAEVAGNRALYRNVLPDVDLLITAEADGFTQVLIVKNRTAAENPALRELSYGLHSDTLRFSLADSGAIRGVDADGTEIVVAPTPFMWDSAGTATDEDVSHAAAAEIADLRALPAVDGPLDGARDAVVAANLAGDTLNLRPSAGLLDDPDTVYPVLIDPTFHGKTQAWTLVSKQHPTSSFWNGKGYNGGTDEARAGHESQTGQTQRSYFRINWDLDDVDLRSATFHIFETHSWSCTKRDVKLYRTDGISSSTTWDKQPTQRALQATVSAAHGYNSSCPDDWIGFNAKDAANDANAGNWSSITFKIQAASETDNKAWKKFKDTPTLDIDYNRKPTVPVDLQSLPLTACTTKAPFPIVGITDLTFKAKATDPDENLKAIHLTVWPQSNANTKIFNADVAVKKDAKNGQIGRIEQSVDDAKFTNGTYLWNTQAVDTLNIKSATASATCGFTVDRSKPNPPHVTSVDFPSGDEDDDQSWKTPFGTRGTFTFDKSGADTAKYLYSFEKPTLDKTVTVDKTTASNDTATTPGELPLHAGPNVLYVKAEDKAKNQSNVTAYLFYVKPRDAVDGPGDTTGDQFADLFAVDQDDNLALYASDGTGDLNQPLHAAAEAPDGYWSGALITHNGDYWAGDGLTDLIARMPDKKLWIYPGNGLGGVDTAGRIALALPPGAPDPGTYTQILSIGDIDGDRKADMVVTTGNELWVLLGYTGARMSRALKLPSTEWNGRTIITVGDHNNDGAADLVYRAPTGALYLRNGKKAGTGTDLNSLATAAASATGKDTAYSAANWDSTNIRLIAGTPNADTNASPPDTWIIKNDNTVWFYPGGTTTQGTGRQIATATEGGDWTGTKSIG